MSFISDAKTGFEKAIEHLQGELATIRTGRATPALVEGVQVEAYGAMQGLKTVASIGTPDSRTIQIEPWDASMVQPIETALMKADLGMTPTVDGKIIRLNLPMMTEESRLAMVKKMKGKLEEAKVSIRRTREDAKKQIEAQEGISKDDIEREVEELEKLVKEYTGKVDDLGSAKEQEVMTV